MVKFAQSGAETRNIFGRRKDPGQEHQCQRLERDMRLRKKGMGVRESEEYSFVSYVVSRERQ